MTRKNKCGACRKAKIKCDEVLNGCSHCVRQGKTCTRDSGKKVLKWVEVKGEVVPEAADDDAAYFDQECLSQYTSGILPCQLGRRKVAIVTTERYNVGAAARRRATGLPRPVPHDEESKLLAKWTGQMGNHSANADYVDDYGGWFAYVPRYFGKSAALNKAACCFLEARTTIANPTDDNIRASWSSNIDAVRLVRRDLETRESRAFKGDILLAVQLLCLVEMLLLRNLNGFFIHVGGLTNLLKQHKKHLSTSDDQEQLLNTIVFQSVFSTGLVPALLAGKNHELDDPVWLQVSTASLSASLSGISLSTGNQAWTMYTHSFILIPRLARLVRLLRTAGNDIETEKEAINIARHLFTNTLTDSFFHEAMDSSQLRLDPTILPELVEEVPMSYRFGSSRLYRLLTGYWMCRLLICGLVDYLITAVPTASLQFQLDVVHLQDISVAKEALRAVQHTSLEVVVTASASRMRYYADEMRLLALLQMAFGAWDRLEKRTKASPEETTRPVALDLSSRMKLLCLNTASRIVVARQNPLMTEAALEFIIELFAGGPLIDAKFSEPWASSTR